MIGGEHSVRIARSADDVWGYLASFPNWAPHVVGYQGLRELDDKTSVWTLRGDVGILSREVEIEVQVSAWDEGRSAAFTLTGLTERLDGTGSFEVRPAGEDAPAAESAPVATEPSRKLGWWARFRRRMARRMIARARGAAPAAAPASAPVETAGPAAYLTFRLEVQPGGPMAPMVEMLMEPLLVPAAEDLSLQIQQALEGGAR